MSDYMQVISNSRVTPLETLEKMQNINPELLRNKKDTLDKDDFLRLLIVQLTNQDPTRPLEDKEFIAQMAQFSALEQMYNLNSGFSQVAALVQRSQALSLLGKIVTINILNNSEDDSGEGIIEGKVEEVSGGDFPQIFVNGQYYDIGDVISVKNE
jgi:flagellar basal-body rod modification protein FlgD